MGKKRIVILGGGESGVGAALLAKKNKQKVFVSDFGKIKKKYRKELKKAEIKFEQEGHDLEKILKADLVIKSPGIPEKAEVIKKLRKKGIKIISEVEYGSLYYKGKIIGITGSNGKTTTTSLTHHLLKEGGIDTSIGGNYGISFCRQLLDTHSEFMVLELSSFQLDDIDKFRPDIAVLLNLSPDHLDRYDYDFGKYIDTKFRLIQNQTDKDILIYNQEDREIIARIDEAENGQNKKGIRLLDYINGISSKDGVFKLKLKGEHNLFNSSCAIEVARQVGLSDEIIQKGLSTFKNEPHRLESVGVVDGVEYINDSKATNVDATYYALKAQEKEVVWIVGGVDKGNDYSQLFPLVRANVNAMVCLGVDNKKLIEAFTGRVDVIKTCQSMEECLIKARSLAYPGEVVLLAPACSSFDLFKNYIDRGDQFRDIVQNFNST
jgi:UDP-N-acetylmuramoylalanine--D-glutamate ligase